MKNKKKGYEKTDAQSWQVLVNFGNIFFKANSLSSTDNCRQERIISKRVLQWSLSSWK